MEDINQYLETIETELNEIQNQIKTNPESTAQYEDRLIRIMENLLDQLTNLE
jgi:Mg2+ and Co2+ transporter CorA